MDIPTTGQIVSLVLSLGAAFSIGWRTRQGSIDVLNDRIKQKDDEIDKLKDQLKTPSELESTVNILKLKYENEVTNLQAEIEKTKIEGDEKEKKFLLQSLDTAIIGL